MPLSPGTRLGAYDVVGKLGEGGMGEVYKARDSKLGRDVAIKVLPDAVAGDHERLARFEREAKLLASLSHANIAQIYGLEAPSTGSGQGGRFLVMELAPGQDLTVRINSGPLPLDEALPIAIQVTHALEAAHDRGIVHRDLKPANIKVSDEGAVKVLDFGLAKAFSPGDAASASAMNSPTLTAQATAAGVILGTAAYMSPEQARGREADKRADVWAFGVVFFEMLTGTRLFQGETISDTLAAVLRQDIPWSALPSSTPAEITRLLRRCLERDRKNRLHDIADARIVLEEVARTGGKDDAAPASTPPARRTPWLIAAAGLIAAVAIGFLLGRSTTPADGASSSRTIRLVVPTPPGVTETVDPAVAADGSFVVFVGLSGSQSQQLYLQRLEESAPRPIPRTDGATEPFISPDGKWIAFRRRERLERIAIDGGEPLPIANGAGGSPGATWLRDGTIVFAQAWLNPLSAVSFEGGAVRQVSTLDVARGEIGHWFPTQLPDPRRLLITIWKKGEGLNDAEIAVLDLETRKHRILFKGAEGRFVAPHFITFFRAGAYHAVKVDPSTLEPAGDPVRVIDDAYGNSVEGDTSQTDVTMGGTLAYRGGPNTAVRQLTWIAPGGKTEPLPFTPRPYHDARLATDGRRVAVSLVDAGRLVLRVLDPQRRTEDVLDLPGSNWRPVWHPDGKHLAFLSMRKGDFDAYWKDLTASGPEEPLLVTEFDEWPLSFVPDGSALIVQQSESDGRYFPKLMPLKPVGPPAALVRFDAGLSVTSRDGKFVAIVSNKDGSPEVYVKPMPAGAAADRISTGGGEAVLWSRDKPELLYLRPPEIIAVTYKDDNGRFHVTGERVWARVEGSYLGYAFDMGLDGRVLVALSKEPVVRPIRVVVNWQDEIARKLK